jgi:hypothetical protein
MIRGINPNIGIEKANILIKKVFEGRFGVNKVVSVNTVRKTNNVQQLYRKK